MKNTINPSIKKVSSVFKDSVKVFGPIGAISGFISDVITPIAPIIDYLAIGLLVLTTILSVIYYFRRGLEDKGKLISFLPRSIVLTVIIGVFSLIGFNTENGYFGDNFESINSLQSSIFNIEQGVKRIEGKVDNIQKNIGDIKDAVTNKMSDIDSRLSEIEKKISDGVMISNPSNLEEYLINSMISYTTGNLKETERMLEKVFNENYIKYDLVQLYYEVLLNNYNADIDRIHILIQKKGFSKISNYFELVELELNNDGLSYYKKLDKYSKEDPILMAYLENSNAKSFYVDVQNFRQVMSSLMCYWTNNLSENKKLLGMNIIKAKSIFFNYSQAFKKYQSNTSVTGDNNAIWDFYLGDTNFSKCNLNEAEAVWKKFKVD